MRINEKGPAVPSAAVKEIFVKISGLLFAKRSWLVLSGNYPPGIPPEFYASLITKCKRKRPRPLIALDADGEALKSGVKSAPDLIKPNLYEFERLAGRKIKTFSAARKAAAGILSRGISYVLLTLGEKGALGFTNGPVFLALPPKVGAKSPVGCGDAFLAGFLHKTTRGTGPAEALRFATACGTAKVMQEGTKMPAIKDVLHILQRTRLVSGPAVPGEAEKLFRR